MLIDDIRQGESAELELKRVPNEQPERWLKTVVAFANCKGGRVGNSIRMIVKRGRANQAGDPEEYARQAAFGVEGKRLHSKKKWDTRQLAGDLVASRLKCFTSTRLSVGC